LGITVILPAAGAGTRLGLTYPKELYEVKPGVKLIDFSLTHIKKHLEKFPRTDLKVAVVITKGKLSVYEYVKSKLPDARVVAVLFDEAYFEWAGSVYSANEHFSEKNIVMLPDSVIEVGKENPLYDDDGKTLIEKMNEALENNPVAFGTVSCKNKNKLSNLGALFVKDEKVLCFQDKPETGLEKYNAFWATYAFKKESAHDLYDFLLHSIKHESPDYEKQLFYPAAGSMLYSYHDLGTWEAIERFLSSGKK
jgi:hypothetical protein